MKIIIEDIKEEQFLKIIKCFEENCELIELIDDIDNIESYCFTKENERPLSFTCPKCGMTSHNISMTL